jgi:hypothetical protein
MQEELNNFTRNEVCHLVPHPNQNVVGTKWVFHNKQNEHGVVTRNKARLVMKGYSQVKVLDFDETYAPIARLECHTRISGHQDPGANIITRCAGTKSHTYDES